MLEIHCDENEKFLKLRDCIKKSNSFIATGLSTFLRLLIANFVSKYSKKKVLFVTNGEQTALRHKTDLKKIFDIEAEIFPYQNISMYETVTPNLYESAKQIKLLREKPNFVIAPVKSFLEKFATDEFYEKNSMSIKVGDEIDTKELLNKLVALGYKRSTMVSDIGEFSARGDIIDIFSTHDMPFRLELWGDEIVDIRYFNNETQKSIKKINEVRIFPLYKFVLNKNIPDFLQEKVSEEGYFEGINVYQNYFNPNLVSILDYYKEYIIIFDETTEIYSKYETLDTGFDKQLNENLKLELTQELKGRNHFTFKEFLAELAPFVKIGLNNFIDNDYDEIISFDSSNIQNFSANVDEIGKYLDTKRDYRLIIATDYPKRVQEILAEKNIFHAEFIENTSSNGSLVEDCKLLYITDKELFNKRSKEVTSSKSTYYKEKAEYLESINDIKEGEYVVHTIHGVGVYQGLSQQQIDGQYKDYLTIEYANKDKLHIPAEQINLLCRYRGSGTVKPRLSRMGGTDWETTKNKVKKEVETIAYDLLRLYAKRKMQTGIQFEPDTNWQVEMEEAFEYTETPDQMRSIEEIKADMESSTPMDRLICGDVGFGKTEVAMRAIFKAVASGRQVAIIVPTTILAMQHYQTISERFKPFAINVELLSRFRSPKQQKETIKNLAMGKCEVVVATHKILQKDIEFKNLGLLVIDEEHRFGVRHKEQLKQLRSNIDVISMSATPIPRTLYMSLSGIKDMSVINTPPKNRLPIKTFVGEWNENMVKNAIVHELDREGQVFYLYNRVETIEEFKLQLQQLIPGARIAIGHAQMDEKALEQVMVDFANREYDILICTTIIENGLDIPNANTMIIHDADKFGLAQLYQLRGRVGRSERQAYCYCFYKKNKLITKDATSRLKAIKEFTSLGSGYQIAMRDVEIRGVGNILGTKQHGHMINVGFDTYCNLLEETIQELKGEKIENKPSSIVDINVTAYIPDEWVGSKEQKMIEYKRLADVTSQNELDYITEEWQDRFSKAPKSVENLIKLIKIRLAASSAGVNLIRETDDNIRIYTHFSQPEWKIIQCKLPSNITKYIKFTVAPKACKDGKSILLLKNSIMNFDEVFNILTDLFYYIHKITHTYTN